MGRTRSVLLILMLLAGSLSPPAAAQELRSSPPLERGRTFQLEPNYPKIVKSETYIPFQLTEEIFEGRDSVVVSLRIFNMLRQLVAIPVAVIGQESSRTQVLNLAYREAGRKIARWDARDQAGQPVPSGVYYCQLEVRGVAAAQTQQIIVDNGRRRRTIIPWFGGGRQ